MAKFLDENGLLYLWSKIKSAFVAKEAGKGLSTNDYTNADKEKLAGIEAGANNYTLPKASSSTLGGIKVGAGLEIKDDGTLNSTFGGTADSVDWSGVLNKPTTVAGYGITDVESGAEVNVQADWNVVDSSSDAYILNKPTIPSKTSQLTNDSNLVVDANYVHTDNNYSSAEKTKLSGIAAGAEVNVQADWNVTDTSSDAFVKNKPSIPSKVSDLENDNNYQTSAQVASAVSGKADKATTLAGYGITDTYTKSEVDGKLTSVYKPQGSIAFASLPAPSADNLGFVYNVSNAFTTTTSFLEGSGKAYPAGSNVVVVQNGDSYAYDIQGGFYDLSPYAKTADYTAITNGEIDTIVAS
ncbi:MAG: hypothetical protein PUF41_11495 [Prevotella copri]|nr:hypothetical protein [Segatella copri]